MPSINACSQECYKKIKPRPGLPGRFASGGCVNVYFQFCGSL